MNGEQCHDCGGPLGVGLRGTFARRIWSRRIGTACRPLPTPMELDDQKSQIANQSYPVALMGCRRLRTGGNGVG